MCGSSQARPWPGLRPVHEARTQGVSFDVPKYRDQMIIILYRKRLESALPDMPAVLIVTEIAAHMGGEQPVHPSSQVAVTVGPQHQVKVVGHQAVGQKPNR